jgi:hypothetical protein
MQPDRVSFAIGSTDWQGDIAALSGLLGDATVIQEGAWGQFEHNGVRVSVGTADDLPPLALMVRVQDVAEAGRDLRAAGWTVEEPFEGEHEIRAKALTKTRVPVILYSPLSRPS